MRPIFHLSIPVRNLDDAVRFYVDQLGATAGRRTAEFVDVLLFGAQIILQNDQASVTSPMPRTRHFGATIEWREWEGMAKRMEKLPA